MLTGGGSVAGAEISVASEVEELSSCVLFNRLVAGLLLSCCCALSMFASDEASASVSEVGGDALRRFRLVDVALLLLSVVLFNRLVAGLLLLCCCALSMLASDEASASVSEVGGGALRRFRLIGVVMLLLSVVLFSRLVAGLLLSCCCALSMLASDEASAFVSEVEGGALRRFRLIGMLVLISDRLFEPLSSTAFSRSLGRGERRRRPVTLAVRFSSGALLPRTFGRAAALVVVLPMILVVVFGVCPTRLLFFEPGSAVGSLVGLVAMPAELSIRKKCI